ncbi:tetratricopeptide repeat protein [Promethearchaeum syntrophicum]|uniref:Tetratricopeptide repeat protein n=1 Tax=Promethearchaeum syntrophicum TaxID=2594042 RepID=A0A5B9DAT7_9ARCH|nr:tetratricopeptide repeat protein [Candidatus Prometheoarchaeum syntrophicum]QEE16248.1 photosystem I assembly protein Ycf3 [Candidatus Prometheoarchaeum syntrophicum]
MLKNINGDLAELLNFKEEYTFLAGAGVSMDSPSNLPSAFDILKNLISIYGPEEEYNNLISIKDLKFESIIDHINRSYDENVVFLDYFNLQHHPNFNHFFLARAILKNHYVITTNFDYMIEYALLNLLEDNKIRKEMIKVIITPSDYKNLKLLESNLKNENYFLLKIHGSKQDIIGNRITKGSLKVTESQLGKGLEKKETFGIESFKKEVINNMFEGRILFILGYSASDDFDISPVLQEANNLKALIWIEHSRENKIEILKIVGEQYFNELKVNSNSLTLLQNMSKTHKFPIYYIKTNTADFLFQYLSKDVLNTFPEYLNEHIIPFSKEIPEYNNWLQNNINFKNVTDHEKWLFAWKFYYMSGDLENQQRCLNKAYNFVIETTDEEKKSTILNNLGYIYYKKGNFNKAVEYFKNSIKIDENLNKFGKTAAAYINLGNIYLKKHQYKESIFNYKKIIEYSAKSKISSEYLSTAYNNIGSAYDALNEKKKASEYYEKALSIDEKHGNISSKAAILNNIGESYREKGDFQTALKYFNDSLKIRESMGTQHEMATVLNNIAYIKSSLGEYKEALEFYTKALRIDEKYNDIEGKLLRLNNIGRTYIKMKDFNKANDHLLKSLAYSEQINRKDWVYSYYLSLGVSFQEKWLQNKLDQQSITKAIEYKKKSLEIARMINDMNDIALSLSELGKIYELSHTYEEALLNYKESIEIFEKLNSNYDIAIVSNQMGQIYLAQNNIDMAIPKIQRALKLDENQRNHMYYCDNLGTCYYKKKDFNKSIEYHSKAVELTKLYHDTYKEAEYLLNLSKAYGHLKNINKAIELINQAKYLDKSDLIQARSNQWLGAYLKNFKKDFINAKKYYTTALNIYTKLDTKEYEDLINWIKKELSQM